MCFLVLKSTRRSRNKTNFTNPKNQILKVSKMMKRKKRRKKASPLASRGFAPEGNLKKISTTGAATSSFM